MGVIDLSAIDWRGSVVSCWFRGAEGGWMDGWDAFNNDLWAARMKRCN